MNPIGTRRLSSSVKAAPAKRAAPRRVTILEDKEVSGKEKEKINVVPNVMLSNDGGEVSAPISPDAQRASSRGTSASSRPASSVNEAAFRRFLMDSEASRSRWWYSELLDLLEQLSLPSAGIKEEKESIEKQEIQNEAEKQQQEDSEEAQEKKEEKAMKAEDNKEEKDVVGAKNNEEKGEEGDEGESVIAVKKERDTHVLLRMIQVPLYQSQVITTFFRSMPPHLLILELRSCGIDTVSIAEGLFFSGCHNLKSIVLADNNLTSIPFSLNTLKELQFLDLSYNNITRTCDEREFPTPNNNEEEEENKGFISLSAALQQQEQNERYRNSTDDFTASILNLRKNMNLMYLSLEGNSEVVGYEDYRDEVITVLPQLYALDRHIVCDEERVNNVLQKAVLFPEPHCAGHKSMRIPPLFYETDHYLEEMVEQSQIDQYDRAYSMRRKAKMVRSGDNITVPVYNHNVLKSNQMTKCMNYIYKRSSLLRLQYTKTSLIVRIQRCIRKFLKWVHDRPLRAQARISRIQALIRQWLFKKKCSRELRSLLMNTGHWVEEKDGEQYVKPTEESKEKTMEVMRSAHTMQISTLAIYKFLRVVLRRRKRMVTARKIQRWFRRISQAYYSDYNLIKRAGGTGIVVHMGYQDYVVQMLQYFDQKVSTLSADPARSPRNNESYKLYSFRAEAVPAVKLHSPASSKKLSMKKCARHVSFQPCARTESSQSSIKDPIIIPDLKNKHLGLWKLIHHADTKVRHTYFKIKSRGHSVPQYHAYKTNLKQCSSLHAKDKSLYYIHVPRSKLEVLNRTLRYIRNPRHNVYGHVSLYMDIDVEREVSAIAIQAFWRGLFIRKQKSNQLMERVLKKRAVVAIQRWWRIQNGLKRRFALLHQMHGTCRELVEPAFYMDLWSFFWLLRQRVLPGISSSLAIFPEFRGVPHVNKDGRALFRPFRSDIHYRESYSSTGPIPGDRMNSKETFVKMQRQSMATDGSLIDSESRELQDLGSPMVSASQIETVKSYDNAVNACHLINANGAKDNQESSAENNSVSEEKQKTEEKSQDGNRKVSIKMESVQHDVPTNRRSIDYLSSWKVQQTVRNFNSKENIRFNLPIWFPYRPLSENFYDNKSVDSIHTSRAEYEADYAYATGRYDDEYLLYDLLCKNTSLSVKCLCCFDDTPLEQIPSYQLNTYLKLKEARNDSEADIRVVQVRCSSLAEARARCALLMCCSYDVMAHQPVLPLSARRLALIMKSEKTLILRANREMKAKSHSSAKKKGSKGNINKRKDNKSLTSTAMGQSSHGGHDESGGDVNDIIAPIESYLFFQRTIPTYILHTKHDSWDIARFRFMVDSLVVCSALGNLTNVGNTLSSDPHHIPTTSKNMSTSKEVAKIAGQKVKNIQKSELLPSQKLQHHSLLSYSNSIFSETGNKSSSYHSETDPVEKSTSLVNEGHNGTDGSIFSVEREDTSDSLTRMVESAVDATRSFGFNLSTDNLITGPSELVREKVHLPANLSGKSGKGKRAGNPYEAIQIRGINSVSDYDNDSVTHKSITASIALAVDWIASESLPDNHLGEQQCEKQALQSISFKPATRTPVIPENASIDGFEGSASLVVTGEAEGEDVVIADDGDAVMNLNLDSNPEGMIGGVGVDKTAVASPALVTISKRKKSNDGKDQSQEMQKGYPFTRQSAHFTKVNEHTNTQTGTLHLHNQAVSNLSNHHKRQAVLSFLKDNVWDVQKTLLWCSRGVETVMSQRDDLNEKRALSTRLEILQFGLYEYAMSMNRMTLTDKQSDIKAEEMKGKGNKPILHVGDDYHLMPPKHPVPLFPVVSNIHNRPERNVQANVGSLLDNSSCVAGSQEGRSTLGELPTTLHNKAGERLLSPSKSGMRSHSRERSRSPPLISTAFDDSTVASLASRSRSNSPTPLNSRGGTAPGVPLEKPTSAKAYYEYTKERYLAGLPTSPIIAKNQGRAERMYFGQMQSAELSKSLPITASNMKQSNANINDSSAVEGENIFGASHTAHTDITPSTGHKNQLRNKANISMAPESGKHKIKRESSSTRLAREKRQAFTAEARHRQQQSRMESKAKATQKAVEKVNASAIRSHIKKMESTTIDLIKKFQSDSIKHKVSLLKQEKRSKEIVSNNTLNGIYRGRVRTMESYESPREIDRVAMQVHGEYFAPQSPNLSPVTAIHTVPLLRPESGRMGLDLNRVHSPMDDEIQDKSLFSLAISTPKGISMEGDNSTTYRSIKEYRREGGKETGPSQLMEEAGSVSVVSAPETLSGMWPSPTASVAGDSQRIAQSLQQDPNYSDLLADTGRSQTFSVRSKIQTRSIVDCTDSVSMTSAGSWLGKGGNQSDSNMNKTPRTPTHPKSSTPSSLMAQNPFKSPRSYRNQADGMEGQPGQRQTGNSTSVSSVKSTKTHNSWSTVAGESSKTSLAIPHLSVPHLPDKAPLRGGYAPSLHSHSHVSGDTEETQTEESGRLPSVDSYSR